MVPGAPAAALNPSDGGRGWRDKTGPKTTCQDKKRHDFSSLNFSALKRGGLNVFYCASFQQKGP